MRQQIQLDQKSVEYTLKKSRRAKRLRLAVYCDGNFVVTAPHYLSQNFIESFIISKARWVIGKLEYYKKFPVPAPSAQVSCNEYLRLKNQALALVKDRLENFNKIYKLNYNKIFIKNQKTVWGSCSRRNNLNFNYKIALLDPKLADYLIVHELCHLAEFNHSAKFWSLVAISIPDYQLIKRELKVAGFQLS